LLLLSGHTIPERTSIGAPALLVLSLLVIASVLVLSANPDEKRISVYSPVANYSLSIVQRDNRDYIGLLEILEPLGTVSARMQDKKWKLRFNDVDGQFIPGDTRARIRGKDLDLPQRFLMDEGRGLVPVDCLVTLLPRFLGIPVTFHVEARRLFISETGTTYTAELSKTTPPKLVLNFSSPVNPTIGTEPGKLHMVFLRDPLLASGTQTVTYNNKVIASLNYQESNGAAEITVFGGLPLLASFSNDGRTITIAAAPGPPTAAAPAAPSSAPSAPAAATTPAPGTPPPGSPSRVFAVIDPAHGGTERGATLGGELMEKDITLAFARRLHQELETRGMASLVLRDPDNTLSLDQRAEAANMAHPAIYITLHATSDGSGVRVFSPLIPAGGDNLGPFVAWDRAQMPFLLVSQSAAASIAGELRKKVAVRMLGAPLRPLNNITAPAVAVEVAPTEGDVAELSSAEYQQQVASAVVNGLVSVRSKLEAAH
jgi:N-acetylmuramoyl-L-alanine amidase